MGRCRLPAVEPPRLTHTLYGAFWEVRIVANILSCNLGSYRGHLDAAYEHLPSIGVKHVEIGLPAPDDIPAVLANLASHGLSPATVMASADIGSDAFAEQWAAIADGAVSCGVKVVFTSIHVGDKPREEAYARIRAAGDECAGRGVTMAMETHPDLMTNGSVALATLQAIDHPNVRMNFDTANVLYYNEGTDTVAELTKVAPYVASVHLKDSAGVYHGWNFPTLGQGIVDFPTVFHMLNEVGMFGPFTMELEGIEGQRFNAEEACADVAASVAYLRSTAEFE
jgi:sugar phosphate isomerase/epimerase